VRLASMSEAALVRLFNLVKDARLSLFGGSENSEQSLELI